MPIAPRATFDNPYGPQVSFRTEDILPPPAYYVAPDDRIICNCLTDFPGLTLNLQIRLLTPQGEVKLMPYQFQQPTLGAYTPVFEVEPVEGYILGATCWAVDPQRGRCFVNVSIVRGAVPGQLNAGLTLVQGYTNTLNVLSYPTTPLQPTFDGRGAQITIGPVVAAGQDWSVTVPAQTLWRLVGCTFYLTTSAAGTPRQVFMIVKDVNGFQVAFWFNSYTQAVSTQAHYGFSPGAEDQVVGNSVTITGPLDIYLPAGYTFQSFTANMDPSDAYTQILVGVEEWMGH